MDRRPRVAGGVPQWVVRRGAHARDRCVSRGESPRHLGPRPAAEPAPRLGPTGRRGGRLAGSPDAPAASPRTGRSHVRLTRGLTRARPGRRGSALDGRELPRTRRGTRRAPRRVEAAPPAHKPAGRPWAGRRGRRASRSGRARPARVGGVVCAALGVPDLPAEVGEAVYAKTRGNPLFLEEVSRALQEPGVLDRILGASSVSRSARARRAGDPRPRPGPAYVTHRPAHPGCQGCPEGGVGDRPDLHAGSGPCCRRGTRR